MGGQFIVYSFSTQLQLMNIATYEPARRGFLQQSLVSLCFLFDGVHWFLLQVNGRYSLSGMVPVVTQNWAAEATDRLSTFPSGLNHSATGAFPRPNQEFDGKAETSGFQSQVL